MADELPTAESIQQDERFVLELRDMWQSEVIAQFDHKDINLIRHALDEYQFTPDDDAGKDHCLDVRNRLATALYLASLK